MAHANVPEGSRTGSKINAAVIMAAAMIFSASLWAMAICSTAAAQQEPAGGPATVDTMIAVAQTRLHFQVIEGGSPTILLEHGGGMDLTEWKDLAPRLARETGATVVSYDRAGFGASDLPETTNTMKEEVARLWDALRQLGLDGNLILVGHSFGGWMVRLEASEHPEAVRGIVFVDPFSVEFVDILGVEYLDNHPMTGKLPFDVSDPSKLTKYQRAIVRMVGAGLEPKVGIMKNTTVPKGIPVVLITSGLQTMPKVEEQEVWRKAHEQMAASIEGAVLIVAEKSNHMIPWMQPDIIVESVREMVAKVK